MFKNPSSFDHRGKQESFQEDIEKGNVINEDVAEHMQTSNAREREDDHVNIGPNASI